MNQIIAIAILACIGLLPWLMMGSEWEKFDDGKSEDGPERDELQSPENWGVQ